MENNDNVVNFPNGEPVKEKELTNTQDSVAMVAVEIHKRLAMAENDAMKRVAEKLLPPSTYEKVVMHDPKALLLAQDFFKKAGIEFRRYDPELLKDGKMLFHVEVVRKLEDDKYDVLESIRFTVSTKDEGSEKN